MNELKLSIARELAQQAFGGPGHVRREDVAAPSALSAAEEDMKRLRAERMARSARAIAEPSTVELYSAAIERQMVTSAKMELVLPSLASLGKDDKCSIHNLAVRTIKSLQVSSTSIIVQRLQLSNSVHIMLLYSGCSFWMRSEAGRWH